MKTFLLHFSMVVLPFYTIASVKNQPEIKLVEDKDRVIPTNLRISILEVAEMSLNRSDETFLTTVETVKNPYLDNKKATSNVIEGSFNIDNDRSILELIQLNFTPQIRGTLAKGDTNYLQFNGGGMLKEGDSFPVKIPQIEGRSFTVTVLNITTRGYALKMNDTIQEVTFEKTSGIIRDSEK